MKAIVRDEYGSPDVLRYEDIEKPSPIDNEVRVQIKAATINTADLDLLRVVLGLPVSAPVSARRGHVASGWMLRERWKPWAGKYPGSRPVMTSGQICSRTVVGPSQNSCVFPRQDFIPCQRV